MKQQKMKITGGTRGKFYRKSTPGSRIKEAAKKIGKTALNVLTGGKSLPLEAARTGFTKSPTKKRLKVKNMPRKQQMAVKATMADGGKGNPNKMKASALKLKKSPALAKLSASCKAAARRKFKVYPSAYANMWASRTQKAGKC